ncbi:Protein of unknown function [Neorhodopirellula lusitana]|uniref:Secreted protein containing DUF1552 n=1 Tax=Neorhodopirellula lusitana TaxID=445327 RepID=A0ABY1PRM4_9BACT|nr:DUF1552 domain-containing protein [Neorhodopirellula lusitana]SMP43745.1 Protein of unknown function [Neorhodopirellula lusitana]
MLNQRCQLISRRGYLAGSGATVALPFLESLAMPNAALAGKAISGGSRSSEPTTASPRLVCMGVSLSMYPGEWNPKQTGRDYAAPKLIEPLEDLRDDFTLISNADHPGVTGGHKGTPAFLSGVYKPERVGQSIVIRNQVTFDQLAARALGNETRFQSLQLGASSVGVADSLSWDEKGIPMPTTTDPLEIYRRLFVDDADPAKTARDIMMGRSVLQLVNADAKELARELSKTDQARLDQYLTSVQDIEAGIRRQLQWLKTPKPGVPPITDRATNYHENLDLILELTALALQTDSSRVVSVALPGKGMPIEVGDARVNDYHGQSHHGKDPEVIQKLVEIERLHTQSLAKFLHRLKSTPTNEGNLLDCTQVLFGSGLGNASSHSNRDLPVLVAGGGFRHGSHVKLREGTPLCNVFVTMMQKLGMEMDSFAGSNGTVNEFMGA